MDNIEFVSNHVSPALYQFKAPFVMGSIDGITLLTLKIKLMQ